MAGTYFIVGQNMTKKDIKNLEPYFEYDGRFIISKHWIGSVETEYKLPKGFDEFGKLDYTAKNPAVVLVTKKDGEQKGNEDIDIHSIETVLGKVYRYETFPNYEKRYQNPTDSPRSHLESKEFVSKLTLQTPNKQWVIYLIKYVDLTSISKQEAL